MARLRTVVQVLVGLGGNGYILSCPECAKSVRSRDAGTAGMFTKDGQAWYRFDCTCGELFKARCKGQEVTLGNMMEAG